MRKKIENLKMEKELIKKKLDEEFEVNEEMQIKEIRQ